MRVSAKGAQRLCLCPRASSELHPEQSQRSELCERGERDTAQQPKLHLGDATVCLG